MFQDPKGERVKVVRSALVVNLHIVAIFWDWASLPQAPRSLSDDEMFKRALSGINEVYASAISTAVLQLKEIPPRPVEYDGWVCLFGLAEGTTERAVRAAFERFGDVKSVSLKPPSGARVCFYTHESAYAAKRAGSVDGLCSGIDTEYNETSYDGRKDDPAGRDDDEGTGWCNFEDAVSGELICRLCAAPRTREALATLPPKMLLLSSAGSPEPVEMPEDVQLNTRVDDVVARIERAKFIGKADEPMVIEKYKEYVARIAHALQRTLAFAASEAASGVELPPMPTNARHEDLRQWHLEVLRAQHASIADALTGRRLDTLTECVAIAIKGKDATGKMLSVRDAAMLGAWLPEQVVLALLTAPPAAGKTWLMSQVIMHLLISRARTPILIKVEQLQVSLSRHEAHFAAATDWVDAYLEVTCEKPYYAMLRQELTARRAVVLIDGLDEAGALRQQVERHIATVLAPQGHPILCTSRPAGLDEDLFKDFHRLELVPLSDAQQEAFLTQRLGEERCAAELTPYLRDKVPLDAETQRRVTANPLMLAMVASIAELRVGIEMPTTTAALYETATDAMLGRTKATTISKEAKQLLQAVFFEAHVDKQRIITESHLLAAVERTRQQAAATELRNLVANDQLPLMRPVDGTQMQAFHLSIQEYYAMREVCGGEVRLPNFDWDVWWMNAVLMGMQIGDEFGDKFVEATRLAAEGPDSRAHVTAALVRQGLPRSWLPVVVEAAGGKAADVGRLKAFVGRYADVIQREGGTAVPQLALQHPDEGIVFQKLRAVPTQRLLKWRNKPQADPCIATFAHEGSVQAVAVSATCIVGGAGKVLYVYDATTDELRGKLEGTSDVQSVAVLQAEGAGRIMAGFEDGTIKVWDSGVYSSQNRLSLAKSHYFWLPW